MKTSFKVAPSVSVKPVKLNVNFYMERGVPLVAIMKDDDETKEYVSMGDMPLRTLINECLQSQDNMGELLKAAVEFEF